MESEGQVAVVISVTGVRLLVMLKPWDGAMEAVVSGSLAVVDGYLGLRGGAHDSGTVLLLAAGTTIVHEEPLIIETLGRRIRLGEHVHGGGGGLDLTHPSTAGPASDVPLPSSVAALQTLGGPPA